MFALSISGIRRGMIVEWYGCIADIPAGWVHCNGSNGTPDMRDIFPVGAKQDDGGVAKSNITGSLLQTGGNKSHSHVIPYLDVIMSGTGFEDGTNASDHIPPFRAAVFMMKL